MMNNNLFFGLLFLSFNYHCTEMNSQEVASHVTSTDSVYVGPTHFSDDLVREDALYTAIIRVDKQTDDAYVLSVQMILKKDSYFVSPNARGYFSGKFTLAVTGSGKLTTQGAIHETPSSEEENDKREGLVHFVRRNTHYTQTIKVLTDENFEVSGHLQFTIEPRCTLEKIPFILTYANGKLSVKADGC